MNGSIPLRYKQRGIGNIGGIFIDLIAEYPWLVAILDIVHRFLCNGVFIGYKVVLTTATCLSPDQPLVIRAGYWDLTTDREFVPHVDRDVQCRIVNQKFNWNLIKHKLALLVLAEQFPRVQHMDLDYDNFFVTGWNYRVTKRLYPSRNIVLKLGMDIEETISPNTSSCSVFTSIPRPEQPMYTKGAPLVCPTESSKYYVVMAWSTSLNGTIQFTDIRKFKEWIYRELLLYNIVF